MASVAVLPRRRPSFSQARVRASQEVGHNAVHRLTERARCLWSCRRSDRERAAIANAAFGPPSCELTVGRAAPTSTTDEERLPAIRGLPILLPEQAP